MRRKGLPIPKQKGANDRDALEIPINTEVIPELATSILSVEATQSKVGCAYIDIFV